MIPRTPNVTGSDGAPDSDPMADIASIVDDAMLAGLDPRRFAFTSVYMRFAEREPWERAAADAGASWEDAAYGSSQGHMLRLSRAARPTLRDLTRMRADALTFAHEHAADWLSMSIEDLQQAPSAWRLVAVRTPGKDEAINEQTFTWRLRKKKLRQVRRRGWSGTPTRLSIRPKPMAGIGSKSGTA